MFLERRDDDIEDTREEPVIATNEPSTDDLEISPSNVESMYNVSVPSNREALL
jgi:hypothetical protein